ncbi:TonB-dependent receptor [Mucilaginibacter gynuensis]|uniref:TonB-dependent receptor n=1 Tax=Mucilaginibacter gynuensis TaxID=1302236 RepID=A0ABP8FTI8_9SPHI
MIKNFTNSLKKAIGSHHLLKLTCFILTLFSLNTAYAQKNATIKGRVTTANNETAASVNITLNGDKQHATSTNDEGSYILTRIAPGTYTLTAKLIGLGTQEKQVTVNSGETLVIDFVLAEDSQSLSEVTVTSGYNKFAKKETESVARMPLKNLENPQVYNIVPKELLQDQVILSYNDVLKNVTGVSQAAINGANSFNLRGFTTKSFLRNGLQDGKANSIEVANIERIEVLKGPSATLFGNSLTSFGGLINRVTKRPFNTFKGEVSYTAGGFGLSRVTADFNTPLNKSKGLLLRTNVAYTDEGSFMDAGFSKRLMVAPSLSYKVNDRLSLFADVEIYNQKANDYVRLIPQASFTKTNPALLNVNWKRSYNNNEIYETQNSVSAFGEVNYKISDQWKSQTVFSRTNAPIEGLFMINFIQGDTAVLRMPGYEHADYKYTEIQQNFNGDFHIGKYRNRMVIGLDYYVNTLNSSFVQQYGFDKVRIPGNDPQYNKLTRYSVEQVFAAKTYTKDFIDQRVYSGYLSDVLNLTDELLVMASLRVDRFVNNGDYSINRDTTTGQFKQTALSPKLGLVYQVIPQQVSVFGNYMNGFKNNAPSKQPDGTPVNFKPSYANQWEAGVKTDLFDGKLSTTVSYYHIKVDDVLRGDVTPGRQGFILQDGGQLSKGVEAELIANPFKGFNIIAGYAYNDNYTINTNKDIDGLRQWSGPARAANLWLSYQLPGQTLKGLGLGIGGNYNSKAYIMQSRSQGEFYLPAYKVYNAAVTYDQPSYRVSLKMDNLTNKEYWGSYVSQMMPRRFSATAAFKFQ